MKTKTREIDLTKGPITKRLIQLALPIMGASFTEMAYSMTDMIWVGKVGSKAVAAVGTAGFYTWLAMAFIMISKMGAQVKVAQSIGQDNMKKTKAYITHSLQINIILAILYAAVMIVWCDPLIRFFDLTDPEVIGMAKQYLYICALGMAFYFVNPVLSSIFNAAGDSVTPFFINAVGLIFNMVMDPILILGIGIFPAMGVFGAAIATVLAQAVVTTSFLVVILVSKREYFKIKLWNKMSKGITKEIVRVGFPAAVQSGLFTSFSMVLGKLVADFGATAIAVQKVGSQIEAISWMTAGGFSSALGAFTGQNYGARKYDRIIKGYNITMTLAVAVGVFASFLLVFFGSPLFAIFIDEKEAIIKGASYLRILGYSQLFMCIEITISGVFNGIGKTQIPALVSIIFTGLRIPLAYILAKPNLLGLDGIWWSVTLSSIIKGILMMGIYLFLKKTNKLFFNEKNLFSVNI